MKRIMEAKKRRVHFSEEMVLNWFVQILLAVEYIHSKNIIHRDIKPQNIFMTKTGIIKLGDFGISKQLDPEYLFTNTSLGTPFYLSPEICRNSSYNFKTDIWMLGCLLHEMCSLNKPFLSQGLEVTILIYHLLISSN